jgi:kynurenine formamidase
VLSAQRRAFALSDIPKWISQLADRQGLVGSDGRLGTLARIDDEARLRAIRTVVKGRVLALGREITFKTDRPFDNDLELSSRTDGVLSITADRVTMNTHGLATTHMDALNHFQLGSSCYGGSPIEGGESTSIADFASVGLVTRAVFLDVATHRGARFVNPMEPVQGADLEAALQHSGAQIKSGDALLVYMGRDAFEEDGYEIFPLSQTPPGRPGIGEDGAKWLSNQPLSALCWDFVDGYAGGPRTAYVHLLIWALGLALVDNCHLGGVRQAMQERTEKVGMLVVSPLSLAGASASPVNPLLLL